jgi:hypothetical protein
MCPGQSGDIGKPEPAVPGVTPDHYSICGVHQDHGRVGV